MIGYRWTKVVVAILAFEMPTRKEVFAALAYVAFPTMMFSLR